MKLDLPTNLLRSFIVIVETGTMVEASQHLFLTQSALSLQMKRLAEIVQKPILVRKHNMLLLTPAGETLLKYAREILKMNDEALMSLGNVRATGLIRFGMVQDFADSIVPNVLRHFSHINPDIKLQIRVSNSVDLKKMIDTDELDIALYLNSDKDETSIGSEEMVWWGDPDLLNLSQLPLIIMTPPCFFRDTIFNSLEASDQSYRVALETPSTSVMRAAVENGLGITCRTKSLLRDDLEPLKLFINDPMPRIWFNLRTSTSTSTLSDSIEHLTSLIQEEISNHCVPNY